MNSKTKIGDYQVVFTLRKGSYYEILRVTDSQNKKYFMRLINLAKLEETQIDNNQFAVSEIEIQHNISHVNIMAMKDSQQTIIDGQRYAFAIHDFCSGETLEEKIARERICTIYEVKQIITGVLNALKYLHTLPIPIIYNGISPESIMLDLSSSALIPRLMDFGHARLLNKENRACFMGGLSPYYIAPELFKGLYSTRTDIYAVGALMYHLIFGVRPWQIDLKNIEKKDWEAAFLKARKHPLPIPDIKIFELDESILNILAKALTQDVDERFQNADDFLKAIAGEITVSNSNYTMVSIKPQKTESATKLTEKKGNGFADVAGMQTLKQRLQDEVIDLIRNPEKYKKLRVKIPNGILLYGPPGCGKTFIAEKFAEELNCNYVYVHCSDVACPYIHGGQEKIASLFQQARDNAPTVLFLDELDAMLTDRSRQQNVSESGEVNEFLSQLNNCSDDGVIIIGATNKPTMIDPAALRSGRLDIKVYVPAPDMEERKALFHLALKDISAPDLDYSKLAELTKGYVSKDIYVLVNKAALSTAKENKEQIDMNALLNAFEKSKGELPSVSEMEIQSYESIREQFGQKKQTRRPVGFNIIKN